MPRYKHIDTGPRLLAVDLSRQLLPGTFEHALHHLLDHEIDLKHFDEHYSNDVVGASAYPPAMLLKIVLFAYSQGIISRAIERACEEQVIFVALSGESCPHFTTIADFVSSRGEDIAKVFATVLYLCQREGLIGQEMFAIDGVKLPSNASKSRSGTRAEFKRQAAKLEAAAQAMLARHRDADTKALEPDLAQRQAKRIARLTREAAQIKQWLKDHPQDRKGPKGTIRKSNRTDNDSAKMATSKGVIQGFCGVAAVDSKHQIIVEAQALGSGSEQEVLVSVVEAIKDRNLLTPQSVITADAGYHSEQNLKKLDALSVNALVADNGMRARDERFADQAKYKAKPDPLHDKARRQGSPNRLYQPSDFTFDPEANTCTCPAGQRLYRNGSHCTIGANTGVKCTAPQRACLPCERRPLCLRRPEKTKVRQVVFFTGRAKNVPENFAARMKKRNDADEGRQLYGQRFATVEPVFGNIRQQAHEPIYAARQDQGRWAVEALLPRTQY
jgi:transposase